MNRSNHWSTDMTACCIVALLLSTMPSEARVGETAPQFAERYGMPKTDPQTKAYEKVQPIMENAILHTYEYQDWKIRAAFFDSDGPAVRVQYQKIPKPGEKSTIQDYEVDAILNANLNGLKWTPTAYINPNSQNKGASKVFESMLGGATGEKMWQRSDGAIAWLRGFTILQLELPAARQYEEQLKRVKEQKARESVPQF